MIRGVQKMKKNQVSAKILLSASILLLIASCGGGNEENQTSDTQVENVPKTSPPETEAPAESTPVEVDLPFLSIEGYGTARDCYNEEGGNAVIAMDCDDLHLGQIISTRNSLQVDSEEGDPEVWYEAAVKVCGNDFKQFTGDDSEDAESRWVLWALIEGDVSDGVYVSCTVEDANGDLWAGTAEAITGSYFGIEVGDCFDFPTATSNALEIDCNEPHEGEMYIVDELVLDEDPSAPYPTEDEWDSIATFICDGPFEDYTGYSASDENVNLIYSYVFGLEEDWYDVDSRLLSCVVVSYDGTLLEGSSRK
jgi:hypothetical protein